MTGPDDRTGDGKVTILARGHVKPEKKQELIELMRARIALSETEPGTLVHALSFESENPYVFVEYMVYENREAFALHRRRHAELEGFLERLGECFATWPYVTFSDPVVAKGIAL